MKARLNNSKFSDLVVRRKSMDDVVNRYEARIRVYVRDVRDRRTKYVFLESMCFPLSCRMSPFQSFTLWIGVP